MSTDKDFSSFMPLLILGLIISAQVSAQSIERGDRTAIWQVVTIDFTGPTASETDVDPNPFLDYRLQVRFTAPSGRSYDVPGYFAGDGSGESTGNVWRVKFPPDEEGTWSYRASFRSGTDVAVSLRSDAGVPSSFDGSSGHFDVGPRDAEADGFARWGRLEYTGGYYFKFADGPYWLKGGTDSPENLLAYAGFGDTPPSHAYAMHVEDWEEGDPDWGDEDGRGIIGLLNYLAAKRVNSIYFLVMNVGGDGQDVWPWTGRVHPGGSPDNDNLHYDVSKLDQWDVVFEHAQRKGIFLHFVLNEAEEPNKRELDDGELGRERKLYYREMAARFGHHLALQWNLSEEYNLDFDLGPDRVRSFAAYLAAVDPYDHPITVHSAGDPVEELRFTFGDSLFSAASVQLNQRRIDLVTEAVRRETAAAGRPVPVGLDEFTVDVGQEDSWIPRDNAELHRKQKLWPTYLSGGNIEFILEGFLAADTLKTASRDSLWSFTWHARKFVEQLPFWKMEPADGLVRDETHLEVGTGDGDTSLMGAQVFAEPDSSYAVYLPVADGTGVLDLADAEGSFTMRWYDPRKGRFEASPRMVDAGGEVSLGFPPTDKGDDWAVLISR